MYRWLVWNGIFRLQESIKRHSTYEILQEMEAADRLSSAELDELRRRKLRTFLEYCYTHVPFVRTRMRDADVEPGHIRGPEDLWRLPLTTKQDIRENRQYLRSRIADQLTSFTTGGSTGEPLIFDLSKRRIAARIAGRERASRWWGVGVGSRELALWGSPVEVTRQDSIRRFRDRLMRTQLLSAFEMNESTMTRYLDVLERGHFETIFAYPSAIHLLCVEANRTGRNLRRLGMRVVFATGEVLYQHQRELISATLGCPVANWYGGRDSGCIGNECPQGGMHTLADGVIVEIVDEAGRTLPAGKVGDIVVTDLYSEEVPFLRYVTGDRGALATRPCVCGRALPVLETIEGRANDCVLAGDGRIINSLALIYPVREISGIKQFRIVQCELNRFHVQLVRGDEFPHDAEHRINRAWSQLLRSPLHVTFEYPRTLGPERSGKFRYVISEVMARRNLESREPEDYARLPNSGGLHY
jgi:phenylacetate-CoA ligase